MAAQIQFALDRPAQIPETTDTTAEMSRNTKGRQRIFMASRNSDFWGLEAIEQSLEHRAKRGTVKCIQNQTQGHSQQNHANDMIQ